MIFAREKQRFAALFRISKNSLMIFSKVLPKSQNPGLARTYAIFTTLFLIVIAFILALFLAFGLPLLLSHWLDKDTPESIKSTINVLICLVTSGLLVFISWDMVDSMIGSAIQAAVDELIEDYKSRHTSEAIIERQNLEFLSAVSLISKQQTNLTLKIAIEQSSHQVLDRRFARDAVMRGLAYDDRFLRGIALSASRKAIYAEKDRNKLNLFRNNIYVYLKAWLMFSIAADREMDIEIIKQQYPSEQKPDRRAYERALKDVKDRLINRPSVVKKLDPMYQEEAIKILEEYLIKLIDALKSVSNKTNVY